MSYDNDKEYAETVKDESRQVDRQLHSLEKGIVANAEIIQRLCAVLERVSLPEQDSPETKEPQDVLVPMADHIRYLNKQVNRNNQRILELMERIQL